MPFSWCRMRRFGEELFTRVRRMRVLCRLVKDCGLRSLMLGLVILRSRSRRYRLRCCRVGRPWWLLSEIR